MNKKNKILVIGLLVLLFTAFSKSGNLAGNAPRLKKITILYTNDTHSRIEPFAANDKKFANLGGYARRAAYVNQVRKEEKNVLLFDAGDVFQGTPYYNFFHGELEFELMSIMGYNAMAIGNHDLDGGIEGLNYVYPLAKFDLLCSNYDFSETTLKDKVRPYKIYQVDGVSVGVFALGVGLKGLVSPSNFGKIKYLNPLEKAAEMAYFLRKEKKCQLIVCLSHLGFSYQDNQVSDVVLAKQSKNIDLIIGGHTHTFIDKHYVFKNSDGKDVIVTQVGWGGTRIGRVDFYFANNKAIKNF